MNRCISLLLHVYTYIYIYNVYFSESTILHNLSGGQKLHLLI